MDAIVERAQNEPIERLVGSCSERAWRLAFAQLRDGDEAFDAVQQAFVVAARKIDRVPADDPWPWFSVVVANEARNLARGRRRRLARVRPTPDPVEGRPMADSRTEAPDEQAMSRERSSALWSAIEKLPEPMREAILLTHIGGMTHRDAGELLGRPTKTVSSHVSRALERLRTELDSRGGDEADPRLIAQLAVLPVAIPTGGWDAAVASWTAGATSALPAVTTTVGGVLVSKKIAAVVALSVCLGVGFVTGGEWQERRRATAEDASSKDANSGAKDAEARDADRETVDGLEGIETRADLIARARRASELEAENAKLAEELESLRGVVAALEDRLPTAVGPVFTFGEAGQLDGVHQTDWKEMAQASVAVQNAILEIEKYQELGEQPPKDVLVALQQNVEKLRKYEYATLGQLPTAAQYNGETTHPITTTNLVASVLREAGLELDESQIGRVTKLGEDYERAYSQLQGEYAEGTIRAQRLLDEYALKGRFTDDLFTVMNEDQRNTIVPSSFRGVAKMDLHDPTLMIIHTSPIITGQNAGEIRTKTSQVLTKQFGIPESMADSVQQSVNAWYSEFDGQLEPAPKSRVDNYTYADGITAGTATIALFEALSSNPDLPDECRAKIAEFPGFFVPRLMETENAASQ